MLSRICNTPKPETKIGNIFVVDKKRIREILERASSGYLPPKLTAELLDIVGMPRVLEETVTDKSKAIAFAEETGYPIVMKVVGPVHKSDAGGVILNVKDKTSVELGFEQLMKIDKASGVLIQPMVSGLELFAGGKCEPKFGHMVLCGLGGIFVEVLKDVSAGLVPISKGGALTQIRELKGYKIIKGVRGQNGVNEEVFADIICKISSLLEAAPEIVEMDINPLIGNGEIIIAVDSRICIQK
jgi:acyl-CoA synthetase (NDP forming)